MKKTVIFLTLLLLTSPLIAEANKDECNILISMRDELKSEEDRLVIDEAIRVCQEGERSVAVVIPKEIIPEKMKKKFFSWGTTTISAAGNYEDKGKGPFSTGSLAIEHKEMEVGDIVFSQKVNIGYKQVGDDEGNLSYRVNVVGEKEIKEKWVTFLSANFSGDEEKDEKLIVYMLAGTAYDFCGPFHGDGIECKVNGGIGAQRDYLQDQDSFDKFIASYGIEVTIPATETITFKGSTQMKHDVESFEEYELRLTTELMFKLTEIFNLSLGGTYIRDEASAKDNDDFRIFTKVSADF